MTKCFILFLLICLSVPVVYSQEWTKKDSLNLSRVLKEEGEIKLNPEAVKQIDVGSDIMGTPLIDGEELDAAGRISSFCLTQYLTVGKKADAFSASL